MAEAFFRSGAREKVFVLYSAQKQAFQDGLEKWMNHVY